MINLFENYDSNTRELHESLKIAGYHPFTIVLNDDGFLPDEVTSPYQYFANYQIYDDDKPAFFNDVTTPPFWEIKGNGTMAQVIDMGELRGKIFYKEYYKTRVVSYVEWLDKHQRLRSVDYYTKEGFRYAEKVYDLSGTPILKKYMDRNGKEVIYENYVTQNIVLDYRGKSYFFETTKEFIAFYLNELNIDYKQVVINSLSTPFITLYHQPIAQQVVLFWQEQSQGHVPGNMKLMFEPNNFSQFSVIIPEREEYQMITNQLNSTENQFVYPYGYLYSKKKENQLSKNILILTNSDQIPHLEALIQRHDDFNFHIGAVTEMSTVLTSLEHYPNAKLYPTIKRDMVEELYQRCDIYLDINEGGEILNAVRTAFDYNLLILGYKETAHHLTITSPSHLFSAENVAELSRVLTEVGSNKDIFKDKLDQQSSHANEISVSTFKTALNQALN